MKNFSCADRNRCFCCLGPAKQKCSQCKVIRYCSRDCQTADWLQHREYCNVESAKYVLVTANISQKIADYEPFISSVKNLFGGSTVFVNLIKQADMVEITSGILTVEVVVYKCDGQGQIFIGVGAPYHGWIFNGPVAVTLPTQIEPDTAVTLSIRLDGVHNFYDTPNTFFCVIMNLPLSEIAEVGSAWRAPPIT